MPSNSQRIVYSGFAAVLSVNLVRRRILSQCVQSATTLSSMLALFCTQVIAAFIIKAFCEPAPPSAAAKKQQ